MDPPQEHAIIVNAYLTDFQSVVLTQRECRRHFLRRPVPLLEQLSVWLGATCKLGPLYTYICHKKSSRPHSARSNENIAAVAGDVRENPQTSTKL